MLGIRVTASAEGAHELFTEPEGAWLWSAAERNHLPAMVSVPGLLPELGRLAEWHPGLRLVIDHLALVRNAKDDAAFGDLPHLLALAKYRTSRPRPRHCRALRARPTPIRSCTPICARCSTRSARSGCSGAPISPVSHA